MWCFIYLNNADRSRNVTLAVSEFLFFQFLICNLTSNIIKAEKFHLFNSRNAHLECHLPKKENNFALSKKVVILIKCELLKHMKRDNEKAAYCEPHASLSK